MAKAKGGSTATAKVTFKRAGSRKRTSDGMGKMSRPKNKQRRRNTKTYRGQGHP